MSPIGQRFFKHRALPVLLLVLAFLLCRGNLALADCNRNGIGDATDISEGTSADCNANGIPDECDFFPSELRFSLLTAFEVGDSPRSLVVADFDDDGSLDLATANVGSDDVSLLTGKGDGTFELDQTFAAGESSRFGPRAIVAADLNRDTVSDLAIASSLGVTVIISSGDGSFESRPTLIANRPDSLVVADFNGDGFADFATGSCDSDDILIFLGEGDQFQIRQSLVAGDCPASIAAADLNGDGHLDLATANFGSLGVGADGVSIYLGDGSGRFVHDRSLAAGVFPIAIVARDLQGDGFIDLVAANRGSNTVSVFLGGGGGRFRPRQNLEVGDGPRAVVAADFNGDGALDLATANREADEVGVLRGLGDGTFQEVERFQTGAAPHFLIAADLDNDGIPDLATANVDSNDVSALLNKTAPPVSSDCNHNTVPDACDISSGDSIDEDGDGVPDECKHQFRRGDVNLDRMIDIVDAVRILFHLFSEHLPISCLKGADIDDNGRLEMADALIALEFLFLGGAAPEEPYFSCGTDATADSLSCQFSPECR